MIIRILFTVLSAILLVISIISFEKERKEVQDLNNKKDSFKLKRKTPLKISTTKFHDHRKQSKKLFLADKISFRFPSVSINKRILSISLSVIAVVCVFIGTCSIIHNSTVRKSQELKLLINENSSDTATDNTNNFSTFQSVNGVSIQNKYSELYKKNSDVAGWLLVPGTEIDCPVMMSIGNTYKELNFEKKKDGNGLVYVDENCDLLSPSDNLYVYGKNRKGLLNGLDAYKDESFFENHKVITFNTLYRESDYEIISVFTLKNSSEFQKYNLSAVRNDFESYVEYVKSQSLYDTGISAKFGDDLLTLICTDYNGGWFVVVAKKLLK